ncbi:MAG: hypothetical protein H6555_11270 [Lewinellaceae bacterium]|nr:hypothetical protein [Lewinellaceae bacterium]
MKIFGFLLSAFVLISLTTGCSELSGLDEDNSFLNTATSGNFSKIFDISNDNSGNVKITPLGDGFTSAVINFGHGTGPTASATVVPGGSATHAYPEGSYTVAIDFYDITGGKKTETYPLQVTYRAPENLIVNISGETQVKAEALYAKSFLVFYGDVANEVGTPLAVGQTAPPHTYPATGGPFVLRVEALSGGAAKTSFSKTLFSFPIDFENANVEYFFGTFGGGQQFATVDNPDKSGLNTSAKVGKFTRGWEFWSGTYSPMNIPINLAYGKKVKVLAYNPDPAMIGKSLNVELEASIPGGASPNGVGVLKVPLTKSGEWEELVFDFSQISAIPANTKFAQLVLRFSDDVDGADGIGKVVYVDNFRLTN